MNPWECVTVWPDTDGHHHQPDIDEQYHLRPQEHSTPSTHSHCLGAESVCASAVSKLLLLVAMLSLSHWAPAYPNGRRGRWQTATLAAPGDSVLKAGARTAQKAGQAAWALPLQYRQPAPHSAKPPSGCADHQSSGLDNWHVRGQRAGGLGDCAARVQLCGAHLPDMIRKQAEGPAVRAGHWFTCLPTAHGCTWASTCPRSRDEIDRVDQVRDFFFCNNKKLKVSFN